VRHRVAIAAALILVGVGTVSETAGADPVRDPEAASGAPEPVAAAVAAAVRLGRTTDELLRVERDLVEVEARQTALSGEIAGLDEQIDRGRSAAADLRRRLGSRVAEVYTRGGSGPLAPLQVDSPFDLQPGTRYTSALNSVDNRLLDDLARVRAALEEDRTRKVEARDEIARARQSLVEARFRLDALRVEAQMLVDQWGGVSVMGRSQLTPAEIATFYASTGIRPRLPDGLTIDLLARLFVEEGDLAGVRGDVAFAQSLVETGSFTEFHGYNFSGIGVCDSCTGGYLFDAARDGVRAQMQLLRSYADPSSRAAGFTVALSPVLYGSDPVEAARRFDTFFLKGSAPAWNAMGNGKWATDPLYAGKVLRMYARMLAHAEAERPGRR
jgi:hypothetical protein